jgi:hypothetical protein
MAWSGGAARGARRIARMVGTPDPSVRWSLAYGPFFGNAIGTLIHRGRDAYALIEGTTKKAGLRRLGAARLHAPAGR